MPKISQNPKERYKSLLDRSIAKRLPLFEGILKEPINRLHTGWALLDKHLSSSKAKGGLVIPSITVLGAEPKIGKSLFTQHIAEAHVRQDKANWTYHLDIENGEKRYYKRLISRRARLSESTLEKEGGFTKEEYARFAAAMDHYTKDLGARLLVETRAPRTYGSFEASLRELRSLAGPSAKILVIIDSLQKLPVELSRDRRSGIDGWLRMLETLKSELDLAILMVSELKRPSGGKAYEPTGTSFKETGDIEYTADLALLLVNDSRYPEWARLQAVWSRDDEVGTIGYYRAQRPYYDLIESDSPISSEVDWDKLTPDKVYSLIQLKSKLNLSLAKARQAAKAGVEGGFLKSVKENTYYFTGETE